MSAFKSLTTQDVIITPFLINKSFTFEGTASLEASDVGIDRFVGTNIPNSILFISESDPTTGNISTQYQRDVYNSVKQLYYTNYINNYITVYPTNSCGDQIVPSGLVPLVNSRYENYLQTTLSQSRLFPTEAYDNVGVLSIPRDLFGDYINPNSFELIYNYLPANSILISASLDNALLVNEDISNIPLLNGNGTPINPIFWLETQNPLNWFDGGIINAPDIISPYSINVTASFIPQSASLYVFPDYVDFEPPEPYVIEATASGITLTLAIDNGDNTYTPLYTTSSNFSLLDNTNISFAVTGLTLTNTNLVLIPEFPAADIPTATTSMDLDLKVYSDDNGLITLVDNGEGNLINPFTNQPLGIITYTHGIAVINRPLITTLFPDATNITCSFQSARTIYETQYKCTVRENEFNYSLNPSLISSSYYSTCSCYQEVVGNVYDFVTGSFWAPYITTVGLYNEFNELLAVAKLSQPLPTSRTTDMSILINLDM